MTRQEFINHALWIANNYQGSAKSVYAWGQLGMPISDTLTVGTVYSNMVRPNNKETTRAYSIRYGEATHAGSSLETKVSTPIREAAVGTFAFDCSGIIQAVLCGWKGDATTYTGGANLNAATQRYTAAGLANMTGAAESNIPVYQQSAAGWNTLKAGDLMFSTAGGTQVSHCGIYLGNNRMVECSFVFNGLETGYGMINGIQIDTLTTAILRNGHYVMQSRGAGATLSRYWASFGSLSDSFLASFPSPQTPVSEATITWNSTIDFSTAPVAQTIHIPFHTVDGTSYSSLYIETIDQELYYDSDLVYNGISFSSEAQVITFEVDPRTVFSEPWLTWLQNNSNYTPPAPPTPEDDDTHNGLPCVRGIRFNGVTYYPDTNEENTALFIPMPVVDDNGYHVFYLKVPKNLL